MSLFKTIGIDPGVSGAVAMIHANGLAEVFDLPTIKAARGKSAMDIDTSALHHILTPSVMQYPHKIFIEQVTSRPRQAGQFQFGVNYGRVLGVLEYLFDDVTHVSPQKWKQALGLRGEDKSMSVALAAELFPQLKDQLYGPRGAALDGRAEALLIAYYGSKP